MNNQNRILIENYLYTIDGSLRASTLLHRQIVLLSFCKFLGNTDISTINTGHLIDYFKSLASDNVSKQSIKVYRNIIRLFIRHLKKSGHNINIQFDEIPDYGIIVDKAAAPINKNDLHLLRDTIRNNNKMLWIVCELVYYCAIRPGSEIRQLQIKDINMVDGIVSLRPEITKNKRPARLVLPKVIISDLIDYGINKYPNDYYVFGIYGTPQKTPPYRNYFRDQFNRYRDALGISKDIKLYSFKHTGAISMVNNGISVWDLQQHMRHSSIATTEIYIKKRMADGGNALKFIDEI